MQYRRQSLAGRRPKRVLRGHIASDILGETLATAPPRGGQFFCVGAGPLLPAGAGADNMRAILAASMSTHAFLPSKQSK